MQRIESLALDRCKFLEERVKNISQSMSKMSKLKSSLDFSKEISTEVDKRYPKASKAVLRNLK
jgi:hypothetical protein